MEFEQWFDEQIILFGEEYLTFSYKQIAEKAFEGGRTIGYQEGYSSDLFTGYADCED